MVFEAKHNLQQQQSIDRGHLLASIEILDEDVGKYVTVGTTVPYAEFVEFGRGPIRPVNAKVLHFFLKDGTEVFTTYAGPAEPRPFLEPAVLLVTRGFSDIIATEQELFIKRRAVSLLDVELL